MPLEFRCHNCDRILRTPDESAGKKARCPQCSAIVDIPLASPPPDETGGAGSAGGAFGSDAGQHAGSGGAFGSGGGSSDAASGWGSPGANAASENPFTDRGAGQAPRPESPRPGFGEANPYAAPAAHSFAPGPVAGSAEPHGELVPSSADLGDLLQTTWNLCANQLGMAIVTGLVFMGINIAFSVVSNILVQIGVFSGEQAVVIIMQGVSQLISFFAQTWLQYGLALVSLRWARTGQPQVADFFAVGPYYLRALGVSLLTGLLFGVVLVIFCGLPAVAGGVIGGKPEHAAIGAIGGSLFALPIMSYIGLSLYVASYFLLDRQAGVTESMSLSNRFMSGNRLTMLLLVLIMGVGGGAFVLVTCCIGSIVVVPFGGLLSAIAYLRITGQPVFQPQVIGTMKP